MFIFWKIIKPQQGQNDQKIFNKMEGLQSKLISSDKNLAKKSPKKFLNMLKGQKYTITGFLIINKMICQKCMHNFNTTTHLPLTDKTGKTQCKECSLKITPFSKNKELSLNKELIRIMGKCPEHLDTDLSLYDVNSRKRRCPKCVIFCADKQKFKDSHFVEIDNNNNLNSVMERQASKTCSKIGQIQQKSIQCAESTKKMIKTLICESIEERYKELLLQLSKLYEKEINSVNNKIEQIWTSSWEQTLKQFAVLQENCKLNLQKQNIQLKTEDKYEKVAQAVQLYKQVAKLEEAVGIRSQIACKELKKYQTEFKCGLRINFQNEIEESKSFKLPLKKVESQKQQLLIEHSPAEFPEVTYIEILPIKCNVSQCTQRTEMASESASEDNFSETSSVCMKRQDKSVLVLRNIQDINKIETHIKEIDGKNLQIGNTEAKKILSLVNKSFARGLDLSNNKLTGIFLKDLNKTSIGKYLKWIKLKGNPIELKDGAIGRKIEQLKSQGVNIIF